MYGSGVGHQHMAAVGQKIEEAKFHPHPNTVLQQAHVAIHLVNMKHEKSRSTLNRKERWILPHSPN